MRTLALFALALAAAGRTAPAQAAESADSAPRFVTTADVVLSGDPIGFHIVGLSAGQKVELIAERIWGRRPAALYRSRASFTADDNGVVDPAREAPTAGDWTGVDPRGPFWAMRRTEDSLPSWSSSTQIHLRVEAEGSTIAKHMIRLLGGHDDLVETSLGDAFPGAFLLRKRGDEPLPVIVALGGSEGGDQAVRAKAPKWASRGYAVVGLPYYSPAWGNQPQQFPELPRAFHDIPLDKLERLRDWLRARDDVRADRIGLYGVSKGAEFVLAAASRIDGFAAVAAIVPSDLIWEAWGPGTVEGEHSCFSWRGEPLQFQPYVDMTAEIAKYRTGERVRIRTPHDRGRATHTDRTAAARIRVEDIDEPVYVLGGDADDTWDSGGMARNIAASRKAAGRDTVAIIDEHASHRLSGDGFAPIRAADARVQGRAFPALIAFFRKHLQGR